MTRAAYIKYSTVLLCLWMDDVLTTEEYNVIIDRLTRTYDKEKEGEDNGTKI